MSKVHYHQESGDVLLNVSTEEVTDIHGKVTGQKTHLSDDAGNVVVSNAVEGTEFGRYSAGAVAAKPVVSGLKDQETEAARLKKEQEEAEVAAAKAAADHKDKGKSK